MKILGLDSASLTGWALLDGERLIERGTVKADEPIKISEFATRLATSDYLRPDLVVIEDSYLGENVVTVKLLSRILGRWEQAFSTYGVPSEIMMADTWQQHVLAGLITRKSKREERKAACRQWVHITYGIRVTEDVADAIGIATWVARRELVVCRMKKGRKL